MTIQGLQMFYVIDADEHIVPRAAESIGFSSESTPTPELVF